MASPLSSSRSGSGGCRLRRQHASSSLAAALSEAQASSQHRSSTQVPVSIGAEELLITFISRTGDLFRYFQRLMYVLSRHFYRSLAVLG
mmetsp:Transcript_19298/g.33318  ORF Transcript_19298/g.33318 Transcript_19298/m.33318 type:complete len:89 (-) Transcript_19298:366-632(-)